MGVLGYGDRLPSVREMARELGVAPRVVLAAYGDLAAEGLVEMRKRSGIYVAEREEHAGHLPTDWVLEVLALARQRGIAAVDLPARLSRSLHTRHLRAVVLESNDDQLYSVSHELTRDYGIEATAIDLATFDETQPLALAVRTADLIVTTPANRDRIAPLGARLGVPVFAVTMCTELFAETRRRLAHGAVYFGVADARFAHTLRASLDAGAHAANLHILVHGRDDLAAIPSGAPTYLTRLTRSRMTGSPLLERLIPEAHVFTDESAREILAFVLASNLAAAGAKPAA